MTAVLLQDDDPVPKGMSAMQFIGSTSLRNRMAQKLEEACQVSLSELLDVGSSGGIWRFRA